MSTKKYDENNVFNKIIRGELKSYKIFENKDVIAILDLYPVVDGHCLLISKLNRRTIMDFNEVEAANYLKYLPKLCHIVEKATGCDGINVLSNIEHCAGQRVFHVHCHIVPRYENDNMYDVDYATLRKQKLKMIHRKEAESILFKMHKYTNNTNNTNNTIQSKL